MTRDAGDALLRALRLDDEAGPARRLGARRAQQMIDAALLAADDESDDPMHASAPWTPAVRSTARPRTSRWWAAVAAVGLLGGGGGAAAARYLGQVFAPVVEELPEAKPRHERRPALPRRPPPVPSVDVEEPLAPTAPPPAPARGTTPAATWIERANAARSVGRWAMAERDYRRAAETAPRSEAAYAAWIAIASLELEHLGDVRRACRIFREQLERHPRAVLAEENALGLAECQRRLRQPRAERATLEAFLARHPSSLSAARVQARLAELRDQR